MLALKQNIFFNSLNKLSSENLGFYFSLILHLLILFFAIGLPNFFDPKPIFIPTIIPIEIINVSEITSLPEKIKDTKYTEQKKVNIKEKKFNSSDNQEIKKIQIKDKPNIKNKEFQKNLIPKEKITIKEKEGQTIELEKEKVKLDTNQFESLPSKKIKPKLKPQIPNLIEEKVKKTDLSIKPKPETLQEPDFNIASVLKDLRNEKSVIKKESNTQEEELEKDILKTEVLNEVVDDAAAELSISEIDLVLQQLSRCFIAPAGAEINKSMFVRISAKIQRNRRVFENSIRIVDTNISKSSSIYGPITESAMRTLLNPDCIPLKLPEEKYDLWKNLTMKFDYSIMRGN